MKVYMLANEPRAWIVTMKGPYVPMKVVGENEVPKEEVEWNDDDLGKIMINNKAINMLQCAFNPTKFHKVSGCDTAKEMWDMLEVTHERTSPVKESKINRLIHMYELFKMKLEESIQDMFLEACPRIGKLRRSQLKSEDFNTLKLEDLIGKLMIYELDVQVDGGVEVVEKKKKDVAFKARKQKEESEDDASDDESSHEEDITKLVSKEVKKYIKKSLKGKSSRRNKEIHNSRGRICSSDGDKRKPSKNHIKCYECNEWDTIEMNALN
ncbi:hypothetical protein SLEP1_g54103 [Rubroshorea leprosula]|uniref:UBN2 domain-containing protein n=1 Tax=Rubroshorea leprosula TaxID=152421 RepID=A0AAV5MDU5_9ROSI|nr:hypothetical protein SLEP1_g54103 [Rubroshorea leprosula]